MPQGLFIVIEGVDGAGTTTQVAALANMLKQRRWAVRETREPSTGPVGALLRLCLSGRLVSPGQLGMRAPNWKTMALMFAADRMDHIEAEIDPLLEEGVCVISDRYYHSSVAYQSRTASDTSGAIAWIRSINSQARKPDLTLVLDVPADQAKARRRLRGAQAERAMQHAAGAAFHLAGGAAGEGQQQQALRVRARLDQARDARRQRLGLARAGAGDHQQRAVPGNAVFIEAVLDCRALLGIQVGEDVGRAGRGVGEGGTHGAAS